MSEVIINEKISYMEGCEHPLSAEIGLVKEQDALWLYDVGNGEISGSQLPDGGHVILSHFHQDHMGNIGRLLIRDLYVSKETCAHLPKEIVPAGDIHVVTEPLQIGNLKIFPLPSSHAKGCLGFEIDSTYAFVGDALYGRIKNDRYFYNVQLLKEELCVLRSLRASFLLVSHLKGFVIQREKAIEELERIYRARVRRESEINWSREIW